jgi:transcriptional regulator with XRE-family HTH domain
LDSSKRIKEFGQYLRKLRKKENLTINQLVEKSGVSNAYISQLENGKRGIPSPEILERLSPFLNVEYEDLLQKVGYLNRDVRNHVVHPGFNEFNNIENYSELLNSSLESMVKSIIKEKRKFSQKEQNIEHSIVNFLRACISDRKLEIDVNTIYDFLSDDLLGNLKDDEKSFIIAFLYPIYEGLLHLDENSLNVKKLKSSIRYSEVPIIYDYNIHINCLDFQKIEGYTMISKEKDNYDYFFWKVPDDYMYFSGIKKGYRVLVRLKSIVKNGKIALVVIRNQKQVTLKRVFFEEDKIILQSENVDHPPLIVNPEEVKIIGEIVKVEFDI